MRTRSLAQALYAATAGQRDAAGCTGFARLFARQASASPFPAYSDTPRDEHQTFHASDLEYHLIPKPHPPPTMHNVKFGTLFTPHMFLAHYCESSGWSTPAIRPFGPLQLHPASQVLHYGMTCFEGMKAYLGPDGKPHLFRPELNMARFLRSVRRLQLAPFDPEEMLSCIKALLSVDHEWLPTEEGHSLYIRPFAFSSADVLGVAKATKTTVSVIMSPVGPYFPSGLRPVTLFVEEKNARAWPGGAGEFKIGGNYAPTIMPQVEAAKRVGAQQVLYTLRQYGQQPDEAVFEECGAMNIFFVIEKPGGKDGTRNGVELITPGLRGTILPGVTRDSILDLVRSWGTIDVSERSLTIREVREAVAEGRLLEVFGCGTACVVQPVGALVREGGEIWNPKISDPSDERALAPRLHKDLLAIQYGKVAGHPWSVPV